MRSAISWLVATHLSLLFLIIITTGCTDQGPASKQAGYHQGGIAVPLVLQKTTLPVEGIKAYITVDAGTRSIMPIANNQAEATLSGLTPGLRTFTVEFEYESTDYPDAPVMLVTASIDQVLTSGSNPPIVIQEFDYKYMDEDFDSFTNIKELEKGTNPYNDASKPALTFPMSGKINIGGGILPNVTLALTGDSTATATTDSNGIYRFDDLPNGQYILTPALASYRFNPINMNVTINYRESVDKDFSAETAGSGYSLEGNIFDAFSNPQLGVTVSLAGKVTGFTTTDGTGAYSFDGLPSGKYELRAGKEEFNFTTPESPVITATIPGIDETGNNFDASKLIPIASYNVSGTVTYSGGQTTGRVFLRLRFEGGSETQYGTSLPGPGSYKIEGMPAGIYTVEAFMDHRGTTVRHASNPSVPVLLQPSIDTTNGSVTGVDITLTDPISPPTVTPPTGLSAYPMDGMVLLFWDGLYDDATGNEFADAYKIYWSENSAQNPTPTVNDGWVTVNARSDTFYIHRGLSNGNTYRYIITAVSESTESTALTAIGPISVGPSSQAGATVSGRISYAGQAQGSLILGVFSGSPESDIAVFGAQISSPASPQAFSFPGIPDGSYGMFVFLDMDGDGDSSRGDYESTEDFNTVSVNGSDISGLNLRLADVNANGRLTTGHNGDSYSLRLTIESGKKYPVAATIKGPNLATPIDLARDQYRIAIESYFDMGFLRPVVGENYTLDITYDDNSTDILTLPVTGVLDSFAMPTAPVGTTSSLTPTFEWQAPLSSPPSPYYYRFGGVYVVGEPEIWGKWDLLPATQTSLLFNEDGNASQKQLSNGTSYRWEIEVVDEYGNASIVGQDFTTP